MKKTTTRENEMRQELKRKTQNLIQLHKRGYLDSKQVVRLGKAYRLRYENGR